MPTGAQSVDRALRLLKQVALAGATGACLAQLSTELGVPKPTCRRLLLALVRAGMVEQTQHGHRYWLGSSLFDVVKQSHGGFILTATAREEARHLAQRCGESCFLSIRRGNFAVLVDRFDVPAARSHHARPGAEYPLGIGAAPLAMIAEMTHEDAEQSLLANDDIIARQFRHATLDRILEGRKEARDIGFSINRGMVFEGIWGLGAALKTSAGEVVGAISLSTMGESLLSTQRQRHLGSLLLDTAARLNRHLPH